MKITLRDLRAAGVCPRAKLWCDSNGIDWDDFKRNGIESDVLEATGDPRAIRVVEIARGK